MRRLLIIVLATSTLVLGACETQEMQQQSDWLNNAPEYSSGSGGNGAGVDNPNDVGSSGHTSGFHSGGHH